MDVDFLLVGQGIAGTALSYRLINSGKTVHIIDQAEKNNCSRVAAGLYNPVTGRKLVKTWHSDFLFPEIVPFYSSLEDRLKVKCLHALSIYRPFASIEEQNEWMGYSGEEEFKGYIKSIHQTPRYREVNDPYGGLLLNYSGYVDLNPLMNAFKALLSDMGAITDEAFDEGQLTVSDRGVKYKHISANALIYANGMGSIDSRYFHWLPLKPNKGEILLLEQDFTPPEIINRGIFRITLPNNSINVGSTYSNDEFSPGPTMAAKAEILEKLGKLVNVPVKAVLEHKTGIRPTTGDRKPILGRHPRHENIYLFNGLGSKGVSLAPYFSKVMGDLLLFGKEPPKDVNISRFFKYI